MKDLKMKLGKENITHLMQNPIQNPKIDPGIYRDLGYNKDGILNYQDRFYYLISSASSPAYLYLKENKYGSLSYTKTISIWIKT